MIIKKATVKDLTALAALAHELNKHEAKGDPTLKIKIWTKKQKKAELSKKIKSRNTKIFVAEIDNQLVGFCLGTIVKPHNFNIKRIGHINSVFVSEKHRKKAIAKKLLATLIDWFKEKNISTAELGVLNKNPSKKVWEKMGFKNFYHKMRKKI